MILLSTATVQKIFFTPFFLLVLLPEFLFFFFVIVIFVGIFKTEYSIGKMLQMLPFLTDYEQRQLELAVWSWTGQFLLLLFPFLVPPEFPVEIR